MPRGTMIHFCIVCGIKLLGVSGSVRLCSESCRDFRNLERRQRATVIAKEKRRSAPKSKNLRCIICETPFSTNHHLKIMCDKIECKKTREAERNRALYLIEMSDPQKREEDLRSSREYHKLNREKANTLARKRYAERRAAFVILDEMSSNRRIRTTKSTSKYYKPDYHKNYHLKFREKHLFQSKQRRQTDILKCMDADKRRVSYRKHRVEILRQSKMKYHEQTAALAVINELQRSEHKEKVKCQ